MKNTVQNETISYSLSFGEKSKFDESTLLIFKEFGAKSANELYNRRVPRSYFTMIQDYNQMVKYLDKALIWAKVDSSNNAETN